MLLKVRPYHIYSRASFSEVHGKLVCAHIISHVLWAATKPLLSLTFSVCLSCLDHLTDSTLIATLTAALALILYLCSCQIWSAWSCLSGKVQSLGLSVQLRAECYFYHFTTYFSQQFNGLSQGWHYCIYKLKIVMTFTVGWLEVGIDHILV